MPYVIRFVISNNVILSKISKLVLRSFYIFVQMLHFSLCNIIVSENSNSM